MRLTLLFPLLLAAGCSALERQDVAADAGQAVGGALDNVLTNPTPGGAVSAVFGILATVAAGYVTRKFIQKKYAKSKE